MTHRITSVHDVKHKRHSYKLTILRAIPAPTKLHPFRAERGEVFGDLTFAQSLEKILRCCFLLERGDNFDFPFADIRDWRDELVGREGLDQLFIHRRGGNHIGCHAEVSWRVGKG